MSGNYASSFARFWQAEASVISLTHPSISKVCNKNQLNLMDKEVKVESIPAEFLSPTIWWGEISNVIVAKSTMILLAIFEKHWGFLLLLSDSLRGRKK